MNKQLHPIVAHILFGDIHEMSYSILGDAINPQSALDEEQQFRVAVAANVQAWIEGKLHKNGYEWSMKQHTPQDRIEPTLYIPRNSDD